MPITKRNIFLGSSGQVGAGVVPLTGIAAATQGDIVYFNGTEWATLNAGTSGYFLKTQGAGANPAWAQTPNAWVKVSDQVVSGGPVTDVDFSSLSLDTAGYYKLLMYWINGTANNTDIRLYLNGDTTDANYDLQLTTSGAGAAIAEAHYDAPYFMNGLANSVMMGEATFSKVTGQVPAVLYHTQRNTGANLVSFWGNLLWVTTDDVTAIKLRSAVASSISNGSRFVLLKYTG